MPENRIVIRRALVSVYDKTGLEDLSRGLAAAGVEIVSTGSTAATIRDFGLDVTAVEEVTGFPEILGGRVKTLHPHIHAGLLADQNDEAHLDTVAGLGIGTFQLVVSNLYPFRATVAGGATQAEAIEQIDIGGPSMVRASAKNHGSVAVVVEPGSYAAVLAALSAGGFDLAERQALAARAFRHTASYDIAVAAWLGSAVTPDDEGTGLPGWLGRDWERAAILRYGENPHQQAALYVEPDGRGLAQAEQLSGKDMSFNNYVDADAAYRAAYDFGPQSACVAIIKHANPCGIALSDDVADAHAKAHACDPVSAFGGVIATNVEVTTAMVDGLSGIFTEVIVAPSYADGAAELLAAKKNLRVLVAAPRDLATHVELRQISGGVLAQTADRIDAPGDDPSTWTLAAGSSADEATMADLAFAWRAVRAVKSNAILLANDRASVGVGMGQVNRVDSSRLAVERAGARATGAVAASDAFFPFPDGLQILLDAGVRAVVQPGGSVRDELTVEAAQKAGVTMYFTGARHFAH
jgi:phosphoribosylaminoimidazolecarboxamide formyltransferase / IMP cyclohydrolase